jgi:hypothetical protein
MSTASQPAFAASGKSWSLRQSDSVERAKQALGGHTSAKMTEAYIRLRETPSVEGPSIRHLIRAQEKAS